MDTHTHTHTHTTLLHPLKMTVVRYFLSSVPTPKTEQLLFFGADFCRDRPTRVPVRACEYWLLTVVRGRRHAHLPIISLRLLHERR